MGELMFNKRKYSKSVTRMNKKKIILDALKKDGYLPTQNGKLRILSGRCVNSTWVVDWLLRKNQEGCQCGFCKVRITLEVNGHPPYTYIVTKKELYRLMEKKIF